MAEIRSTMDLVMEKAARMGKATADEMEQEASRKQGMQLAAEFLNQESESLAECLAQQASSLQVITRKGMLEALLRNLFLARDEEGLQRIDRAIQGIIELGGGAGDLTAICQELQGIISQYDKHRNQYYEQLKEQMRMQIEQMVAQKTGMPADGLNIDPTTEPQFKEEWSRLEGELNGQYEQALEQYRTQLKQRLGV
ncbi:DUF6657 family protein [Desulfogranum mediterraneum]|uniref:DUF6657 family protein n=1 Tax=Desulfogranum mediterraneum TaxID=160661 RepID=UPI00040EB15B|nr:DUF6657 family protein [Desulfogranum mediterraneum]